MDGQYRLGEYREVGVRAGVVRYREAGSGPPIVFLHGALVNGELWRNVVPELAGSYRCIAPDLPLGAHQPALSPDADLSLPGLAGLVADLLAALDLRDVTLVGHDTGGAVAQGVCARHPERIGRLVLSNCDCFENFLPPLQRPFRWIAYVPGGIALVARLLRLPGAARRLFLWGRFSRRAPDAAALDAYTRPLAEDAGVRRDLGEALRAVDARHTLEAARTLRRFDRPVLIAWAPEDTLYFTFPFAERLAALFPDARLERIADSYTFVPEDQPERLAELIGTFIPRARTADEVASICL